MFYIIYQISKRNYAKQPNSEGKNKVEENKNKKPIVQRTIKGLFTSNKIYRQKKIND